MRFMLRAILRISIFTGLAYSPATVAASVPTHALDIRDCFSPLLVTTDVRSSTTKYSDYYLAMMDEKSFDKIKADGKESGLSPEGYFDGSFGAFQEKVTQHFELHQENIDYYRATASNVSFLPPEWQPTISDCIKRVMAASSTGLSYLIENTTAKRFRLEIKYTSSEGDGVSPNVRSSEITGGYTEVNGKKQGSLYICTPAPWWKPWGDPDCPKINSRSEFVVTRDSPNEPVTISLNLGNPQSASFDVPILPKPIECQFTYVGAKRKTAVLPPVPARWTTKTYGSGGWQKRVWLARAVAPGMVTAVSDHTFNDATDMNSLDWSIPDQMQTIVGAVQELYPTTGMKSNPSIEADEILWAGTQGGGGQKTVSFTVEYKDPVSSCSTKDWK